MKLLRIVGLWSALYGLLLCSCYADDEQAQLEGSSLRLEAGTDATLDSASHRSVEGGSLRMETGTDATSGAVSHWFEDAAVPDSGRDAVADMDADVEGRRSATSDAASPAFEVVPVPGQGEDSGVETDADTDDQGLCAEPSSDCVSKEEYEVLSAVIRQKRLGSSDVDKVVAIYDTVGCSDVSPDRFLLFEQDIRFTVRSFDHDLGCCVEDYIAAQQRGCYLSKDSFSISDRITLVGRDGPYYGTSYLSRVGFDKDGRRAMVAHDLMAAPLAGTGVMIYLEKVDGEWIVREELLTWIS